MRTGYYLRAKRDGKFQSLDIAEMSENEIKAFFEGRDRADSIAWVVALAAFIKAITPLYMEVEKS